MTQETEGERISRIQSAHNDARNADSSGNAPNQFQVKKGAARPKVVKPLMVEIFEILPLWMREIAVGVGVGLVPAILVAILLPGAFKLLSILVLLLAGGAGYMLGGRNA